MTTRPAATCLFNESMSLPFFHLEDVFLTGFAAENCGVGRYHSDGFHPNAVNFADLKETDILWHYLKTKSVHHMHHVFMYNELLANYHHVNEELKKLQREQAASNCKIFADDEDRDNTNADEELIQNVNQ